MGKNYNMPEMHTRKIRILIQDTDCFTLLCRVRNDDIETRFFLHMRDPHEECSFEPSDDSINLADHPERSEGIHPCIAGFAMTKQSEIA